MTGNRSQFVIKERPQDLLEFLSPLLARSPGQRHETGKLKLQLDDVCFVVDPHGPELAQDVLPQQTVKGDLKALRKIDQVHYRNRL